MSFDFWYWYKERAMLKSHGKIIFTWIWNKYTWVRNNFTGVQLWPTRPTKTRTHETHVEILQTHETNEGTRSTRFNTLFSCVFNFSVVDVIEETKDICAEGEGYLCQHGKCVNTDDGGYICECNEGFMNVAVEGGYRCQGRSILWIYL